MKFQTNINRRRLGRTGLMVTELGFGAMNLRKLPSFEDAYKIVNFVLDNGINLIDTARTYKGEIAPGVILESESVLGKVIAGRTDLDEPIVIISKCHGYTVETLEKELAESRAALGITGKGDLKIGSSAVKLIYFLHGINAERWAIIKSSGALERLQALKEEGLINYTGFSSHYPNAKEIKEAIDTGVFDVMELPYNVFNRSLGEDGEIDLLKHARERDMGIVNMKAFDGNGMPPVYPMLREFISIDYEKMLNFCLSNPYVSTVDAGAKLVPEFEYDIKTALMPRLTETEKRELTAEADKVSGYMKKLCRQCMHCLEKFECPGGVPFVDTLSIYSKYLLANSLGKNTDDFVAAYNELTVNGSDCAECGECLQWCEYKLNIPEMLKSAHEKMKNI